MFSKALASEKDREELTMLREQIEELKMDLKEKDDRLKSAENSREQMNAITAKFDELKHQVSEKNTSLNYTQQQLSDAKVLI